MKTIIFICVAAFIYNANCAPAGPEPVADEVGILFKNNPNVQVQKSVLVYEFSDIGDLSYEFNRIIKWLMMDNPDEPLPPQGLGGGGGLSSGSIASILG